MSLFIKPLKFVKKTQFALHYYVAENSGWHTYQIDAD